MWYVLSPMGLMWAISMMSLNHMTRLFLNCWLGLFWKTNFNNLIRAQASFTIEFNVNPMVHYLHESGAIVWLYLYNYFNNNRYSFKGKYQSFSHWLIRKKPRGSFLRYYLFIRGSKKVTFWWKIVYFSFVFQPKSYLFVQKRASS